MPVTLSLYSEPYGSTGNIGENFLRLLGTPSTDPLQTMIREAVQNIADAAKLGQGPSILIRLRRLNEDQRACMQNHVLRTLPDEPGSRTKFKEFLAREEQIVLEICDFGTTGLGGPTRADRLPVGIESNDFINFLRNIGAPRDTDHGGGTYGFGKASLYAVSRCKTILVDTLVSDDGDGERRLIGCHIGSRHEVAEDGYRRQFTGRHWWGVADPDDGIADPALGTDARELAAELGFPPRGEGQSGTSIMMLDFNPEGEDLMTVGHRIVEGLLYSFWPRMMKDAPAKMRFSCQVEVDGEELEIPDPEDFPPLHLFCRAMRKAREQEGGGVERIFSERPAKDLGWLAIEKGLRSDRTRIVAEDSLFRQTSRHIALMRPVQLVVKYLEGTALPDEGLEWAGVFLASDEDEVERAFALSEPPAHDDWIPGNLEKGYAKTYVNVALRKLETRATEIGMPASSGRNQEGDAPPLARVSGMLGAALEGVTGEGAGRSRRGNGGGGGSSRPARARASRPVFVRLEQSEGRKVAIFTTSVLQDTDAQGERLHAAAAVALDGAAMRQVDQSMAIPEILEIRAADGTSSASGDLLVIDGASGEYEIVVSVPDECAVTVDAEVQTGGDA